MSPQAKLQPRHMNMAPLVSSGQFWFCLRLCLWGDWVKEPFFFPLLFFSSWQRQHTQFRGHHWQCHINWQQLWIHGYVPTRTHTHFLLSHRCHFAVSLQGLACSDLAVSFLRAALVPHRFSVCLCSSGQEPFKRRPILNHLHHIAIRIGDTLPHNWLNQFRDLHQTNQHYVNHTSMRLRYRYLAVARLLICWHWNEQRNNIDHAKIKVPTIILIFLF